MAEGRFVSRSIATSGQLKRVSLEADYLFMRMIPHLDREGRIDGDPDVVKAMACPLRQELTSELISTCLAELDAVGLIQWYEVDGQQVAQFPAFKAHQRGMKPERERISVLPARDAQGAKSVRRVAPSVIPPESSALMPEDSRHVATTSATKLSEVKLSEVKVSKEKLPSAGAVSWPGEAALVWRPVAPIPIPRLGRALKPVVDEYGWPATKLGLEAYIELNKGKPRKVEWFVDDAVRWLEIGNMPAIDQTTGEPTERGRLALRIS